MSPEVEGALRAINRRFYQRFAAEFDATRERPWPGWERIVDHLAPTSGGLPGTETAVLDVGCGNGRLATFLTGRLDRPFRYLGIDSCESLLSAAERRLASVVRRFELRGFDVLEQDPEPAFGRRRFDLVALFGVLHHVPGSDRRQQLLHRLGRLLAPAGILAVSIWRLDRSPRLERRIVPWESYNRRRARHEPETIDPDALEAGDVLLSWGGDDRYPRYCHFPDDAEIDRWIRETELQLTDRFEADGPSGRDNLYLVWRGARSSPGG